MTGSDVTILLRTLHYLQKVSRFGALGADWLNWPTFTANTLAFLSTLMSRRGSLPLSPCRRRLLFCITGSLQAPTRSPKMRESTEAGRRRTNTPGNSKWWSAWSSPLYCPCSALSSSSESVSGRFTHKKNTNIYILQFRH